MFEEHGGSGGGDVAAPPGLASIAPGPELAALLASLDAAALSGHDLVEAIKASERLASWVASVQLELIGELGVRHYDPAADDALGPHTRSATGQVFEFADVEIAAALRLSRGTAGNKLGLAVGLARLPATRIAWRAGCWTWPGPTRSSRR